MGGHFTPTALWTGGRGHQGTARPSPADSVLSTLGIDKVPIHFPSRPGWGFLSAVSALLMGRASSEGTTAAFLSRFLLSRSHSFSVCARMAQPPRQVMPGQRGQWQSHALRLGRLGRPEEAGPALQGAVGAVQWVGVLQEAPGEGKGMLFLGEETVWAGKQRHESRLSVQRE